MESVEFIDSTGIGLLLNLNKKILADNGRLVVINTNESIQKAFSVAGADKWLELHSNVEEPDTLFD